MSILQIRLKNCIQTILELEPAMAEADKEIFAVEFSSLKSYLSHVEDMELAEEDVRRLEHVTSDFLAELVDRGDWRKNTRLLQ